MSYRYTLYYILSCCIIVTTNGSSRTGLLLLYRPTDVSNECAFSGRLRYDLSFGMGMSDTITMIFRTLSGIDYECNVEVIAQTDHVYLIVVIKFPTTLLKNCLANKDAFMVMKKNKRLRLCDLIGQRNIFSSYFVITVKGRLRFKFLSNSSINSDINAELYQVTATTARLKSVNENCKNKNETLCIIELQEFCFTSGVVCDGIKNCGVRDWFDERISECSLLVEYLGYAPAVALVGAIACFLLAAGHVLLRFLPSPASSFFIFNSNEDNRLCIDPLLHPPENTKPTIEKIKRISLIPVLSSTSSYTTTENDTEESEPTLHAQELNITNETKHSEWKQKVTTYNLSYMPSISDTTANKNRLPSTKLPDATQTRRPIVRQMTAKIQEKLRSVSAKRKMLRSSTMNVKIDDV